MSQTIRFVVGRGLGSGLTDISLGDRLAGAIWGHLVGDAVGVPYEFTDARQPSEVKFGAKGSHDQPPGTWSDDGALMLALLDSLLDTGFDTTDQGPRALAWAREGKYAAGGKVFDMGSATGRALDRLERGVPAEEAGADENALGNGSLMRILPLALVERDVSDRDLVEHAHRASKVTHGALAAQVPCALYVHLARRFLAGEVDRAVALADGRASLREIYSSGGFDAGYLAALHELERWEDRSGRGLVTDSFWSAWDAFAGADSYADTVKRAVAYGKDTDTTAAIAGGLAGIYWGIDGIPAEWLAGMLGKEVVRPIVAKLLDGAGYKTAEVRVAWVTLGGVPALRDAAGKLGMTFVSGKRYTGRAGKHWRDVLTDAAVLRDVHGVDTLLLLVEDHELDKARVRGIDEAMSGVGIELIRHPIEDGCVPADREAFRAVVDGLTERIQAGRNVVVACMGGLGRTGTAVACVLREGGLDGDDAIALTRMARPAAIETRDQVHFVESWQPSSST